MKKKNAITITITTASAILLATGCAHEERSVRTDDSYYSSGRISEYNQNNYTTPSVGGSYSSDGAYSSGGGGYSAAPNTYGGNYSGTVGADGTYTPNTPADTSAAGAAFSSTGSQSDNLLVQQVNESLRQDPEIAVIAPNIQVSAQNGAVVLSGHCQSEEQKRQILDRVQKVTGVVTVNNQLNVMAGPNGQNSNGLTPTGNSSDSQRLYKNANGQDTSTNNVLNSTSRPNGQQQLYQENTNSNGALNPTSRQNENSQLYKNSSGVVTNQNQNMQNGQNQNTNNLNPTSRQNGSSQIYQNQNSSGVKEPTSNNENLNSRESTLQQNGQNQSTNNMQSTDTLSPTSRQNGTNSIYQNNPGEKSQDTNNVQRMP